MNVLIFSETLWPYGGGGELATYLYARYLSTYGTETKIILKDYRSSKLWKGLKNSRLRAFGYGKYFVLSSHSVNLVKELINWSDVTYFTGLFNLIPLVKALRKPVVTHVHSYFPLCPIGHLYNFANQRICKPNERNCFRCIWIYESMKRGLKRGLVSSILNSIFRDRFLSMALVSDALIFVSRKQKKLFLDYVKALRGNNIIPKSYVIYNPIPKVDYTPIRSNDIGFLGGLDPIKGWGLLFRAWLKVYKGFPHLKLRAAMTSSLPASVELFNIVRYPKLDPPSLEKFYEHVRAIAVPSIAPETSSYVAVEALLRGRLLVASRVGGVPEIVEGAPGVRLVPPGDVDALADALEWAFSMDKGDVVELGLRNRERVLRRFDNERSVNELIRVFNEVSR